MTYEKELSIDKAITHAPNEVVKHKELGMLCNAEGNVEDARYHAFYAIEIYNIEKWLKELKAYREARKELEDRKEVAIIDLIDSYMEGSDSE